MDADATVVAAYLFHILGIPSDVDVNETIRNLQANKKATGVHCSRVCTVALGSAGGNCGGGADELIMWNW
jgi:hypothetical protein